MCICVCMYEGKREVEGRLTSAQTALMLQEEAIRRSDRDRKQQSEKINNLERAVQALESEKRQFQVWRHAVRMKTSLRRDLINKLT